MSVYTREKTIEMVQHMNSIIVFRICVQMCEKMCAINYHYLKIKFFSIAIKQHKEVDGF